MKADEDPGDRELAQQIKELSEKASRLASSERQFFRQKAKLKHLLFSDRNSSFFHSMVKRNNSRNLISFLCRNDGSITKDQDEIIESFIHFYSNLFGTERMVQPLNRDVIAMGYRLDASESLELTRVVSVEEIKAALFDIGNEKAPGPDGYSSAFFKAHWETVGEDLIKAVKEFFLTGRLLRSLNSTIISLIPKTSSNPKVSDFRPIACCNVVYKVITKIMSKRMEPLLPKLVNPAQSAFISGRNIMDNIYLAQELMRKYNYANSTPRCTVKIDLRKAYDTINWNFLRDVLHGLRFPPIFVNWIMECVTTPSFSIAVNGSIHGYFRGKQGLRQGDPMSPSLFILCIEYLSRLLIVRATENEFNFHAKCERLKITHLAFADDLMLFGRGDRHSMIILANVMKEFSDCSGLEINRDKSNIFIAGVHGRERDDLAEVFGFPIGTLPVRYLGIPLASSRLNLSHYAPLIDKMTSLTKKWAGKTLSYAGKLELIRSVLQGIECYWLQVFPLPKNVRDRVISIARSFLWGGAKKPPVAWETVCLPKEEGGLGVRDLKAWNKALHSKILWNIHAKKDSLWIQWIHGEYIRGGSIWDWRLGYKESPLIKHLLSIRDEMLDSCPKDEVEKLWEKWDTGQGTAEAYEWFRPKSDRKFWAKFIWKDFVPPKFSFTTWQAIQNGLLTRDRLTFLNIDQSCPLCSTQVESAEHLFFMCDKIKEVWDEIKRWLRLGRSLNTIKSAIKWMARDRKGSAVVRKGRKIALSALVNLAWKARNALVFEGKPFDPRHVTFQTKTATYSVLYSLFPRDVVLSHLGE